MHGVSWLVGEQTSGRTGLGPSQSCSAQGLRCDLQVENCSKTFFANYLF
jgi:cysteine synthase